MLMILYFCCFLILKDGFLKQKTGKDGLGSEEMDKNFGCAMDLMSSGRLLDLYGPLFCFLIKDQFSFHCLLSEVVF